MPLTTQDLDHGVDMTGIASPNASDFNNLVDQSTPHDDGGGQGRGLVVVTIDAADNVPTVPDATATLKWKRYIWARMPFSVTSPFLTPKLYAWNEIAISNPIYLKWMATEGDIEAIEAEIATLTTDLATTNALANNAYSLATSVSTTATNALAKANDAETVSASAQSTAIDAQTTASNTAAQLTAVQTSLTNVTATANAAQTAATDAQTEVTTFVTTHKTALLAQTAAQNTNLAPLVAGENAVVLNTIVEGGGGMVLLTAGKVQFNNAGTYIIDAVIQAYINNDRIQAKLIKDSDATIHGFGTVATELSNDSSTHYSHIRAVITTLANEIYRFSLFANTGNGLLGIGSNVGPEYFHSVRIDQIA